MAIATLLGLRCMDYAVRTTLWVCENDILQSTLWGPPCRDDVMRKKSTLGVKNRNIFLMTIIYYFCYGLCISDQEYRTKTLFLVCKLGEPEKSSKFVYGKTLRAKINTLQCCIPLEKVTKISLFPCFSLICQPRSSFCVIFAAYEHYFFNKTKGYFKSLKKYKKRSAREISQQNR